MRKFIVAAALAVLALLPLHAERQSVFKLFDALTAAGATPALDLNVGSRFPTHHTVAVTVTGAPATCTYQLEGCLLDSTACAAADWEVLSASGGDDCTVTEMFHVTGRPVRSVRVNLTALTGGSSPTVTPRYLGVR